MKTNNILIDVSNYVHRVLNSMVSDEMNKFYKDTEIKRMTSEEKKDAKVEIAKNLSEDLIKHTLFNRIESLIKNYKTKQSNCYLFFDEKATWLEQDNYKSGRNKDLKKVIDYWINYLENSTEQTNLNKFRIKDLEADHAIRLFCKKTDKDEVNNIIYSNDKDFIQLLKLNNTTIYNPFSKEELKYNKEQAQEAFLIKVISGDLSDNIPSILPSNLIVEVPVRKRTDEGMKEVIETVDISSIQFGEKTLQKLLKDNNNDYSKVLKEGREKMFKKQSKKEEYIKYSLDDLEKMLLERFLQNKKVIDFDEIPEKNIKDFDVCFSKLNLKNMSDKNIYDFYQKEKLYKLSDNYKDLYYKDYGCSY